jgi:phospholipid/cholesterol/gamma-HCH transport system permease protein
MPRELKKHSMAEPAIIRMPENINRQWVERTKLSRIQRENDLTLDFSATTTIDSAGFGFIRALHLQYGNRGKKLLLSNLSADHLTTLQQFSSQPRNEHPPKGASLFFSTGDAMVHMYNQVLEALSVLVEMLYWGTVGMFRKQDFKRGALGEQMYQLGFKAVGIVALLSFLIGVVLSLQTAMQLRTFGAGIFLAPLIGITMVREMGPLLTAIILAGRTGSATTAEIATMGVSEEIDALRTMGINPVQFVIVPKFWAITFTMPLLSIIATTAGILGGYVIAITYLDLAPSLFFGELIKNLRFEDFTAGFIKSVAFSWLIIWIGSFYGLRVHGGAEAVGKETTESVVTGIFIIIIADAIFSFIL